MHLLRAAFLSLLQRKNPKVVTIKKPPFLGVSRSVMFFTLGPVPAGADCCVHEEDEASAQGGGSMARWTWADAPGSGGGLIGQEGTALFTTQVPSSGGDHQGLTLSLLAGLEKLLVK